MGTSSCKTKSTKTKSTTHINLRLRNRVVTLAGQVVDADSIQTEELRQRFVRSSTCRPMANTTVQLCTQQASGKVLATTTTESDGWFYFKGIASGKYSIKVVNPGEDQPAPTVINCRPRGEF